MVAIVTGTGLGLQRGSAAALGSQGQLGSATVGQGADKVTVNAANGNLVIQSQDEMLIGVGLDDVVTNTYNSQGTFTSNGWQESFQRHVAGLTGTVNTAGSTITHYTADGSAIVYTYNSSTGVYVGNELGGAYDTLSFNGSTNQWTWQDGKSRATEVYDNANSGRLIKSTDASGNALTYSYTGSQLTKITTANGDYTSFSYTGSLLTSVVTSYTNASGLQTETRVRYGYDGSNRLTTVTTDLSPSDNSVGDGKTYVTTYGYSGTSDRVTSITQSDGSSLSVTYNANTTVASVTQTTSAGVTSSTFLTYGTGRTTVTDQQGNATTLVYDGKGELTQLLSPPSTPGGAVQAQSFSYDANGNVTYSGPTGDPNFTNITQTWGEIAQTDNTVSTTQTTEVDSGVSVYRRQTTSTPTAGWAMRLEQTGAGLTAVSPGQTVQLGVYAASSGASSLDLWAEWFNASGGWVGDSWVNAIAPGGVLGAGGLATASQVSGSVTVPAGAAYAALIVQAFASGTGSMNIAIAQPTVSIAGTTGDANFTNIAQNWGNLAQTDGSVQTTQTTEVDGGVSVYRRQTNATPAASWLMQVGQTGAGFTAVSPGQTVDMSVYVASLGASSLGLFAQWFSATGAYLGSNYLSGIGSGGTLGASGVTTAIFANGTATAMAGAAYAQIVVMGAASGTGPLNIAIAQPKTAIAVATGDPSFTNIGQNWGSLAQTDNTVSTTQTTETDGGVSVYRRQTTSTPASGWGMNLQQAGAGLTAVAPGQIVSASVYAASSGASSIGLWVSWYNASGGYITSSYMGGITPGGTLGSVGVTTAYQGSGSVTVPVGAAYAGLAIQGIANGAAPLNVAIAQPVMVISAGSSNASIPTYNYTYDANGNRLSMTDALGNETTYSYDGNNQLLTKTGAANSAAPETTRYVYDGNSRLAYTVSPRGDVTRYIYNAQGEQTSVIQYTAALWLVAGTVTKATLDAWATPGNIDLTQTNRTDTTYDVRGQVASVTTYGQVDSNGNGVSATAMTTAYVYDQAGQLLSRQLSGSSATEAYVYDGLGRVISSTDFNGKTTLSAYSNTASGLSAVVTLANGTTQTSTYNLAGELISTTESGGGLTATTSYVYDGDGNLIKTTDPTGLSSYFVYNAQGEKVADVAADGAVTAYAYNADGQVVSTVQYATKLTWSQLLPLVNESATSAPVNLSSVTPPASTSDRWSWNVYDAAGRLVEAIDPSGAVTSYSYDAVGRLSSTTAYATRLPASTLASFETSAPTSPILPAANATADRTTRTFYNADDQVTGTLDADGYLTQVLYNAAGQKVQTITYANATAAADRAGGSFTQLLSDVGSSGNDIYHWWVYDGAGLLRADIDGLGNITRYDNYTADGDAGTVTTGQTVNVSSLIGANPPVLANLPTLLASATGTPQVTTYSYDQYGHVLAQTLTLTGGAMETTTYTYDALYNLISQATASSSSATGAADGRTDLIRYDSFGRKSVELSGLGAAALAALGSTPTQAQINAVWAAYQTVYTYDAAGRLVSTTDANNHSTLFYYDVDGRLTYQVDASGDVVQYSYNAFGEKIGMLSYATPIAAGTLAGLSGGQITSALTSAITSSVNDSYSTVAYNADGTVASTTDALNVTTTYAYDAFGDLTSEVDPLSSGVTTTSAMTYSRRGLLLTSTADAGGLGLTTSYQYDAFGRATQVNDPDGNVTKTTYDRAGEVLTRVDALNQTTSYSYDGLGHVLSVTDPTGARTTYAYSLFDRQVTVTDPNNIVTTTTQNAYGQTVKVVDGTGAATSYAYDADGNLITMTDGDGNVTRKTYDNADRLAFSIDPTGAVTGYTYDADGRVVQTVQYATLAPGAGPQSLSSMQAWVAAVAGANDRTTQAVYDGEGRLIYAIDVDGYVTAYSYDNDGRVVSTTRYPTPYGDAAYTAVRNLYLTIVGREPDPSGWPYFGNQVLNGTMTPLQVAQTFVAAGEYQSDLANFSDTATGNQKIVDYFYHAAFNTAPDANGVGYVTALNNGTMTVAQVALAISQSAAMQTRQLGMLAGLYQSVLPSATGAQTTQTVYDADGRTAFTIDPTGAVTGYTYDADGNVIQTVQYATLAPGAGPQSLSSMQAWVAAVAGANDRTTQAAYDAAGRLIYAIDADGYVTAYSYDNDGRVVSTARYPTPYGDAAYTAVRNLYLTIVGREPDPSGWPYFGNQVLNGTMTPLQVAQTFVAAGEYQSDLANFSDTATGNQKIVDYFYHAAFNTAPDANGVGYVTALNNGTMTVAQVALAISQSAAMQTRQLGMLAGLYQSVLPSATGAQTTQTVYDADGRTAFTIDPTGAVTGYTYDADGNVIQTVQYATLAPGAGPQSLSSMQAWVSAVAGSNDQKTTFGYDRDGRLLNETVAAGTSVASSVSYTYDAAGNKLTAVDGDGHTTHYTYDADGRVLTTTDATGAVTTNQYDAFGNLVKVTDPRGNAGYFYYDAMGNQIVQIDAQGYATQTTYDMNGQVLSVRRYFTPVSVSGVTATPPALTTSASDNVTSFTRDTDGRVLTSTDGNGYTTGYSYDAFGDKVSMTNALGGTVTYSYDALGQVLTQTTPASSVLNGSAPLAPATTTAYIYDAFGNRIQMVEAQGRPEQRTTNYVYDADNRLVQQTGDAVTVTANSGATWSVIPTQTFVYDARGNQIKATDADGGATYTYYDLQDQKIAQVDVLGHLTTWSYDAAGNMISQTQYTNAVSGTPPLGGTPPTVVAYWGDRTTTYGYDADNRQTSVTVQNVESGSYNNATGTWTAQSGSLTTTTTYDADGNVIKTTDANGNSTYSYYDKLGRQVAEVDAGGYLTSYTLDAEGNTVSQTQYATAVAGTPPLGGTPPTVATNANDRTTTFTYDHDGQRLSETRSGASVSTISGDSVSTTTASVTVSYSYNALGQVNQKTEATGDVTTYQYDSLGRLVRTITASNASNAQTTQYAYDGLGNVLTTVAGYGTSGAETTTYTYGAGGRLSTETDAMGFTTTYGYDAKGLTTVESYSRVLSNGASVQEATLTAYDALGRNVSTGKGTWNGSAWIPADLSDTYYDAFGEVIATGTNTGGNIAKAQTFTDYDIAGRVWRTNSGDGVTKVYGYDGNGNQTVEVTSQGTTDLRSAVSLDAALSAFGTTKTYSLYDARNELLDVKKTTSIATTSVITGGSLETATFQLNVSDSITTNTHTHVTTETLTSTVVVTLNCAATAQANGGGTIHVVLPTGFPTNATVSPSPTSGGSFQWTQSVNTDISDPNTNPIPVTVYQDGPGGTQIPIASATLNFNYTPNTYTANPTVIKTVGGGLTIQGVDTSATSLTMYARPIGSSGGYTQVTATAMRDAGNTVIPGAFVISSAQPPFSNTANSSWDVKYLATNASGQVVDAKAGTVTLDGGSPPATMVSNFVEVPAFTATLSGGSYQLATNPAAVIYSDFTQTFDAFGDTLSQTDARGKTTSYAYDALGDLTQKAGPSVTSVGENGTGATINPTDTYYYDASGREVGHKDANNNLTTQLLLAGTGYDGSAALTTVQYDPDGGIVRTGYDIFGNALTQTDAMGDVTTNSYDRDNRLITVAHAARSGSDLSYTSGTSQLIDSYVYDGLGQRIRHTDNVLSTAETTDYDVDGRVTQTTSFGGQVTTYNYTWTAGTATTRVTAGQASGGYWTKTTSAFGQTSSTGTDAFGTVLTNTDFGGHVTTLTYNLAGQLTHQASTAGQSIDYSYTMAGQVATIADNATGMRSAYAYDAAGNRTREVYYQYQPAATPTYYENATVTYDALNRVTEFHDLQADITYSYDANGNRREVKSVYSPLGGANQTQDFWYKYDSMNRFVLTEGTLSGGVITTGTTGTAITYDARGDRMTASNGSDGSVDTYAYSADGYLETVKIGTTTSNGVLSASRMTDVLGRETSYTEYQSNGTTVLSTRAMTYDNDNRVTAETDQTYGMSGSTAVTYTSVITNDYRLYNSSAGTYSGTDIGSLVHTRNVQTQTANGSTSSPTTTNSNYFYTWWSQAKSQTTTVNGDPLDPNANSWLTGKTNYVYDVNGNVSWINDQAAGRTTLYTTDAFGQVMTRKEYNGGVAGATRNFFYLNGQGIGDVGNDSLADRVDYAQQLATDRSNANTPAVAGETTTTNTATPVVAVNANFDANYQAYDAASVTQAGSDYTVTAGDTLQSIAQNVWGDSSLWYALASANGLSAGANLNAGESLVIPDNVVNLHDNSQTFKAYNPNDTLGNTNPTLPQEPQPAAPAKHGCGVAGDVLAVVIAAAVTYLTFGATAGLGTILQGATAMAAGDAAYQGTEMVVGNQSQFNWAELATSAVAGGISGGLGLMGGASSLLPDLTKGLGGLGQAIADTAASNAIHQGVNMAFGLQKTFNWTSLAVSGVAGAVGYEVGPWASQLGKLGGAVLTGTASGLASAATESLLTGQDLGKSIRDTLPSAIGNTIGDMVAGSIEQQQTGASTLDTNGDEVMTGGTMTPAEAAQGQDYADAMAQGDPSKYPVVGEDAGPGGVGNTLQGPATIYGNGDETLVAEWTDDSGPHHKAFSANGFDVNSDGYSVWSSNSDKESAHIPLTSYDDPATPLPDGAPDGAAVVVGQSIDNSSKFAIQKAPNDGQITTLATIQLENPTDVALTTQNVPTVAINGGDLPTMRPPSVPPGYQSTIYGLVPIPTGEDQAQRDFETQTRQWEYNNRWQIAAFFAGPPLIGIGAGVVGAVGGAIGGLFGVTGLTNSITWGAAAGGIIKAGSKLFEGKDPVTVLQYGLIGDFEGGVTALGGGLAGGLVKRGLEYSATKWLGVESEALEAGGPRAYQPLRDLIHSAQGIGAGLGDGAGAYSGYTAAGIFYPSETKDRNAAALAAASVGVSMTPLKVLAPEIAAAAPTPFVKGLVKYFAVHNPFHKHD